MKIDDKVIATVTKNGYYTGSYRGKIVGFTKNGRVKVKSYRGVKMHSKSNVKIV